jgi:hypothetical protein
MKSFKLVFAYRKEGQLYFESKIIEARSLKDANTVGRSQENITNQYWFRKDMTKVV